VAFGFLSHVAWAIVVLVVVVLGFFRIFGDYIYSCRAEEGGIHFRFFRYVSLWKIPYSEIADVRPIAIRSLLSLRTFPFSFISRPGAQLVLIERNRGLFKNVLVTPTNPDRFIATIRAAALK
jgi:hypothetical protein